MESTWIAATGNAPSAGGEGAGAQAGGTFAGSGDADDTGGTADAR